MVLSQALVRVRGPAGPAPGRRIHVRDERTERRTHGKHGIFLEILPGERLVFTDAFVPGWRPAGAPFMAARITLADAGEGRTAYEARAMHWNAETRAQHEAMGFHAGWGLAADQLEALARGL